MADDPNTNKPNPTHAKKLQMGQDAKPEPKAAAKAEPKDEEKPDGEE